MPKEYGRPSTVWRRFKKWSEDETLLELRLNDKEKIAWDELPEKGSPSDTAFPSPQPVRVHALSPKL
jgi:hypothetical protein